MFSHLTIPRQSINMLLAGLAIILSGSHIANAGENEVRRLSEPVTTTSDAEIFGAPLDNSLPLRTLEELSRHENPASVGDFRLTTRVAQVCQAKGCFFIAQEGATTMRVSFKDYGFFVPTDISGKRVTLAGELIQRELTPVAVEHFAEDLGDDEAPLEAGIVYEIVATSVSVPLS